MAKTINGKKRESSMARLLALALVAVLDESSHVCGSPEGHDDDETARFHTACANAREVLKANGYSDLESIPSRRRKLDAAIKDAMAAGEWDKVGKLSSEMKRAEQGLPPLTVEKKPRAPRKVKTPKPEATEKKSRKKKGETASPPPLGEGVPVQCLSCPWEGVGSPDSKCPECGNVVALDVTDESVQS